MGLSIKWTFLYTHVARSILATCVFNIYYSCASSRIDNFLKPIALPEIVHNGAAD